VAQDGFFNFNVRPAAEQHTRKHILERIHFLHGNRGAKVRRMGREILAAIATVCDLASVEA